MNQKTLGLNTEMFRTKNAPFLMKKELFLNCENSSVTLTLDLIGPLKVAEFRISHK